MAAEQNLQVTLGETWEFPFALNDENGDDLNITGGDVAIRISRRGVLFIEETTAGDDVVVDSPSVGVGAITVSPQTQAGAALFAAVFDYEVRATLADGRVTTQAKGTIDVQGTLF